MKINKNIKRLAAQLAARKEGFSIRPVSGRGLLRGSRLELMRSGALPLAAAVRTSDEGLVGFSRDAEDRWRPLHLVDWVLVADSSRPFEHVEVLAFAKDYLIRKFDAALAEMVAAGRAPSREIPIFIALHDNSKKNLGHTVAGIQEDASWRRTIDGKELAALAANDDSEFFERVKREFAERNGVDVGKVTVEFRIIT